MSIRNEYLEKAKNKTQKELIDHLIENNGSMIITHLGKAEQAMKLAMNYPEKFNCEVMSNYPYRVKLKTIGVYFLN